MQIAVWDAHIGFRELRERIDTQIDEIIARPFEQKKRRRRMKEKKAIGRCTHRKQKKTLNIDKMLTATVAHSLREPSEWM